MLPLSLLLACPKTTTTPSSDTAPVHISLDPTQPRLCISQVPEGRQLFPKLTVHRALSIAEFGYILEHGRVVLADTTQRLMDQEDVKEFYLGIAADVSVKGYKRYKRKKRWR